MKLVNSLLLFILLCFSSNNNFAQNEGDNKLRIGTFDSRCVAIAYGRTDLLVEIQHLRTRLAKAKEMGDTLQIKELEELGPTKQVLMHQQGFSTGSVNNIIAKIKDKIKVIADKNNVLVVVSKWELAFADDSVVKIDLTDEIVELFDLDSKSKGIIENIKTTDPVPLEQISINPMH